MIQGKNTWFERADIRNLTGETIHKRIASLEIFKGKKMPQIDLMIGGPSCQGFSRAGRRDVNDPRNMLFGEYVRVINEIKPRFYRRLANRKFVEQEGNDDGKRYDSTL